MRTFDFPFTLSLFQVVTQWARQRPVGRDLPDAERDRLENEYLAGVQKMAEVTLAHADEFTDAELVRAMRFIHDLPIEDVDFAERFPTAYERFKRYEYREPEPVTVGKP